MPIHRVAKELMKTFPYDRRLTYGARGICTYLLTKPDDFKITFQDIVDNSENEGKDRIRAYLRQLEKYRYWVKLDYREGGRFETEYHFFAEPLEAPDLKRFINDCTEKLRAGGA